MTIPKELLDQLLEGRDPAMLFRQGGLLDEFKRALVERVLEAEMDHHLAQERSQSQPDEPANHRNGYGSKTLISGTGEVPIRVPRDRKARFEPVLIAKYRRRFPDFDDQVISLYARGLSMREIQGHVRDLYGVDVSHELLSSVTDQVLDEVAEWQNRPLEAMYAVVFFDALRVKVRDEGTVRNKAVYLALGVRPDGTKEALGLWLEQTEGAKFWLRVMNELRSRGVQDVLIAVVDGLKGFPEAINSVFPDAQVQTCIVHLLRHSMSFVSWKDRRGLAAALRPIYTAVNAEVAAQALEAFAAGAWGRKYPTIVPAWQRQWQQVIPFFAFPPAVRRIIYSTNAIESLNSKLRSAVRSRGHFPSDEAACKLLFLVLRQVSRNWKMPPKEWAAARTQFAVMFGERFTASA
ncbi:MAG: IS256 family transposase [Acetobacteraceae bacterium]|nr:IS256 family transposase [Acetobacteraceae bacterium]